MSDLKKNNEKEVKKTWQALWAKREENKEILFDDMSKKILDELLKNFDGNVKGKKILESGSGRGVISAELASLGAEIYLLDISKDALEISKRYFEGRGVSASFIQGDLHDLPFFASSFDIVWNAGVLEHFIGKSRSMAVNGLGELVKPKGLFVSFNPSEDALFYKMGKESAERNGKWPYGPEYPIKSLKGECNAVGLEVVTEYPTCFKENFSFLSFSSKWLKPVLKLIFLPLPEQLMLKLFGGYLLVTVARKQ